MRLTLAVFSAPIWRVVGRTSRVQPLMVEEAMVEEEEVMVEEEGALYHSMMLPSPQPLPLLPSALPLPLPLPPLPSLQDLFDRKR